LVGRGDEEGVDEMDDAVFGVDCDGVRGEDGAEVEVGSLEEGGCEGADALGVMMVIFGG